MLYKALALALLGSALGERTELHNELGHHEICGGMYGPDDSFGPKEPEIIITFPERGDDDNGELALIVFNFVDIGYLGTDMVTGDGRHYTQFMCDQDAMYGDGPCTEADNGKFIVNEGAPHQILTDRVKLQGNDAVNNITYKVKETGYYCIVSEPTPGHEMMKYGVGVQFQNAHGFLPAKDYPLILYHFVQCLVYVFVFLVWLVPLIRHRQLVLKAQKYITALSALLIFEQAFAAAYYYVVNKRGAQTAGSRAFLVLLTLWGSARLAYTFFLLMIVSCGYSVVHPCLGPKMKWCRISSGLLFVACFVYSLLDYYSTNSLTSNSGIDFWDEIMFFPFAVAVGVNYIQIFKYLGETMCYLRSRKQSAKVAMYRYLSTILVGSLIAVCAQLILLIAVLLFVSVRDFIGGIWRFQWLIYDGWPNIVYCVALVLIMVLWRPSANNNRYAMSTQLAQNEADAEEFEIGSLDGSDDELHPADFDVGIQRAREQPFDETQHHDLSDLEGDFEVGERDRNFEADEDPLVDAGGERL